MKRPAVLDSLSALADPIRARLLLVLDRHELTVGELHRALQLPQSTVSRHLRALANARWVTSREDGTSNRYRMGARDKDGAGRKLWHSVRDELGTMPAAHRDEERVRGILAARHTTTQKFFASGAAQWERVRTELFGARTELFALLGLFDREWTAADLGCGTGQLAEAIAPFVRRVIAVDESAAMLRAARARLGAFPNVEVRQGTIETLPIESGEVDFAVLSLVLHYVPEPPAALKTIRRALKDGGRLVIVDMLPHDRADLAASMGHAWQGFAPEQLSAWTADAGFASCRVHPLPASPAAKGPNLFAAVLSTATDNRRP